eukprot:14663-Heterococcus_DN1.PRE.4
MAHVHVINKFLAIKGVVFFSWWQGVFIEFLEHKGHIEDMGQYPADHIAQAVIAFYFAFPLTDFVPSGSSLHHLSASSHTTAATAAGSTTAIAASSSGSSGDDTYPLLLHVPIQQQQQAGAHSMTRSRHNTHIFTLATIATMSCNAC